MKTVRSSPPMEQKTIYLKGISLALIGVFVLSFDALLIRISGVSGFKASFWRGGFAGISLLLVLLSTYKGRTLSVIRSGGKSMVFSGLLWGLSGIAFSLGVIHAGAGNTLVMMSLSPLFAAAYSRLVYRERQHCITLVTAVGATGGIMYMFQSQIGSVDAYSLLITLGTPLCFGVNLSHLRKHRNINRMAVCMMGGFFGALISFIASGMDVLISLTSLLPLCLLGSVVVPFAQTIISQGTRYISASDSALITSLETVIGIFYMWLFLQEIPSPDFLTGALVVMLCITVNSVVMGQRKS